MSTTYTIRCNHCGTSFQRRYGLEVNGQGTLYCDRCGKAMGVDFSGGWFPLPQCDCGGSFDADALGCCPNCGARLSKQDIGDAPML